MLIIIPTRAMKLLLKTFPDLPGVDLSLNPMVSNVGIKAFPSL